MEQKLVNENNVLDVNSEWKTKYVIGKGNIKDDSLFDINKLDLEKDIFVITEHMKKLKDIMMDGLIQIHSGGTPSHASMVGPKGTGKTYFSKTLSSTFKEQLNSEGIEIESHYVNCSTANTSFKLYQELSKQTTNKPHLVDKEFYNLFDDKKIHIIIVDEMENFNWNSQNDNQRFFYNCGDHPKLKNVFLLMISNRDVIYDNMLEKIHSRLQPRKYMHHRYQPDIIFEILDKRCKKGLRLYEDSTINKMIASLTTKEYESDMRLAIKAAGTIYGKSPELIPKSYEEIEKVVKKELENSKTEINLNSLQEINERETKALYCLQEKKGESTKAFNLFNEKFENISGPTWHRLLNDLEKYRLLDLNKYHKQIPGIGRGRNRMFLHCDINYGEKGKSLINERAKSLL